VRMVLATIGQIITQGHAEYEAKYARRKTVEEAAPTGSVAVPGAEAPATTEATSGQPMAPVPAA
jgi:hypothetical protein